MVLRFACAALLCAISVSPVGAEPSELDYPKGSLGFAALMNADYATAEVQLRNSRGVARNDPARLINLGVLLARTGRRTEGISLLEDAARAEEVELVLSDGRIISSRQAARLALAKLDRSYAAR